jgi:hypothetical protein
VHSHPCVFVVLSNLDLKKGCNTLVVCCSWFIGAVAELSTYQVIDEVDEPDFVEMLDECDANDRLGIVGVPVGGRVLVGIEGSWIAQIDGQHGQMGARKHVPGVEGLSVLVVLALDAAAVISGTDTAR